MTTVHDFTVTTLEGSERSMRDYAGKVLLIVNTASHCGFTPQYAGLEKIYEKYRDKGFEILGFPCNQFGQQEPGDADAIGAFCERNYGVKFPMHEKIEVNGPHTHPLYRHLKHEAKGLLGTEAIKWNFTKFLVDRKGRVVRRYGSNQTPESFEKDIARLVNES